MKIVTHYILPLILSLSISVSHADFSSEGTNQKTLDGENTSSSSSWLGHYSKKSDLCTSPNSGNDCSEQFHDSLTIEQSSGGYLVSLHSTQANQNICAFTFQMDAENGALVYKTKYGSVLIQKNGETLKISSAGTDPTALGLGVCGIHADIDGLTFPLNSESNTVPK